MQCSRRAQDVVEPIPGWPSRVHLTSSFIVYANTTLHICSTPRSSSKRTLWGYEALIPVFVQGTRRALFASMHALPMRGATIDPIGLKRQDAARLIPWSCSQGAASLRIKRGWEPRGARARDLGARFCAEIWKVAWCPTAHGCVARGTLQGGSCKVVLEIAAVSSREMV